MRAGRVLCVRGEPVLGRAHQAEGGAGAKALRQESPWWSLVRSSQEPGAAGAM